MLLNTTRFGFHIQQLPTSKMANHHSHFEPNRHAAGTELLLFTLIRSSLSSWTFCSGVLSTLSSTASCTFCTSSSVHIIHSSEVYPLLPLVTVLTTCSSGRYVSFFCLIRCIISRLNRSLLFFHVFLSDSRKISQYGL